MNEGGESMIFLAVCDFLVPVTMIITGLVYRNRSPKEINKRHGYRTTRSMKNQETWNFAQKTFSRVALLEGAIMLGISLVVVFLSISKGQDRFNFISFVLSLIQIGMLLCVIYFVEKALKKTFDENGIRKR